MNEAEKPVPEGSAPEELGPEGLGPEGLGEETATVETPETGAVRGGALRRAVDGVRRRWVAALGAAVLLSVVLAGSVYWWVYRPDQLTDVRSQEQVLEVARGATEALLSYSPESVDTNVADAKSRLTGDFLERYSQFADTVVVPAAKERGVKTEANVARVAVSQMRPDSAHVLAFVNQVTTSKERPTPALATSSVMMTLVRQDGRWLISEFNPI